MGVLSISCAEERNLPSLILPYKLAKLGKSRSMLFDLGRNPSARKVSIRRSGLENHGQVAEDTLSLVSL